MQSGKLPILAGAAAGTGDLAWSKKDVVLRLRRASSGIPSPSQLKSHRSYLSTIQANET